MKYESNAPMYSKDIAQKHFFVRTGRMYIRIMYVRTDKGEGIKKYNLEKSSLYELIHDILS